MGKPQDTRLSEEDKLALEQVVRKSPDWRARAIAIGIVDDTVLPTVSISITNFSSGILHLRRRA